MPGTVYRFDIELWPAPRAFHAGHRIRLEIASMDSPLFDFPFFHLPDPRAGVNRVFHSAARPSYLTVPVIDSVLEPAPGRLEDQVRSGQE